MYPLLERNQKKRKAKVEMGTRKKAGKIKKVPECLQNK